MLFGVNCHLIILNASLAYMGAFGEFSERKK